MPPLTPSAAHSDAELLDLSLTGNRDAYGQLVTRYQVLACSLAYAACGDFARSQDLAQEAFVAAWRQLPQLRDRSQFKGWLCGIVRQRAANVRRQQTRQPATGAEPLESAVNAVAPEPPPDAAAISAEEQRLVWQALGGLPETYREPLILFYREGHSVARVASALNLGEDAVKQRLARGRSQLREQLSDLIEGVLVRSAPGPAFTGQVLAVLPLALPGSAMAMVASSVGKAGTAAKGIAILPILATLLGPVLGILGAWLGFRVSMAQAGSEVERQFLRAAFRRMTFLTVVFMAGVLALALGGRRWFALGVVGYVVALMVWILGFMGLILGAALWMEHQRKKLLRETPEAVASPPRFQGMGRSYRSSWTLFGLPLVDIQLGPDPRGRRGIARGWIAAGDVAMGVLLAVGGVSCGGIAIGGVAVGGVVFSGVGLGGLVVAGAAFGYWAVGGLAVGWLATGGCAVARVAAEGGLAVAREFAVGGFAQATHANDAVAREFFSRTSFFRAGRLMSQYGWLVTPLALLPLGWQAWRQIRGRRTQPTIGGGAEHR